ncbi:hypothetical protein KFE25_009652 [Diacronema lutheri]|uniref:Protein kinase domain-containing protein n=3 Tax=Diacronema lutheri TaxID=2081491 RepID=A0A8J6CHK2_DIALT|nr:hypothetical protein KFE25_009652 [Diacronema lutheri]
MAGKRSRWEDSDESDADARQSVGTPIARRARDVASNSNKQADGAARAPPEHAGALPAELGAHVRPPPPRKAHLAASFTGKPLPVLAGCRSVDCYERLRKIDEGTYGIVWKARERATGEVVALKQIKVLRGQEGFPITSLREINILLALDHENIINVREVVTGGGADQIFMVMDCMETDLKAFMAKLKDPPAPSEVKSLMQQLLSATAYMHDRWVVHRDLKTSNLLFSMSGALTVCDFGMARHYSDPIKKMSTQVVTLWYRAPEILLGSQLYTQAVDMWSVGCIFAEIISLKPLLPGQGDIDQIERTFKLLGTPNDTIWPGYSQLPNVQKGRWRTYPYNRLRDTFCKPSFAGGPAPLTDRGLELLNAMLTYDPERRISARDALAHAYFREEPPPKPMKLGPMLAAAAERGAGAHRAEPDSPPIARANGASPETRRS